MSLHALLDNLASTVTDKDEIKLAGYFSKTVTGTGQQQLNLDTWDSSRETEARSSSITSVKRTTDKPNSKDS